jgi:hypothetical protein
MRITFSICLLSCLSLALTICDDAIGVQTFKEDVTDLVDSSCIGCHDDSTDTDLNFEELDHDLSDPETYRMWEKVFDRTEKGEMPPESEDRPDPDELKTALTVLKTDLLAASVARQSKVGRVPSRRLTKRELGYTMQDLLWIADDVTTGIPDEVDAGSFDTVGETQRISAVHMESYLAAADEALGHAIKFGENPYFDYGDQANNNFSQLESWHDKPLNQGGNMTRKLKYGKGVALFGDVDYLTVFTYGIERSGKYRMTAKVAAYQSQKPVTAKFIVKNQTGGARIAKAIDLLPGKPQTVVVETHLLTGDKPYLTFDTEGEASFTRVAAVGGAKNMKGSGLAILSQKIEGPIYESWPPPATQRILKSVMATGGDAEIKLTQEPLKHVEDIVTEMAPRVFRQTVDFEELASFIDLAKPAIEEGRKFQEIVKVPLRSMLTSPKFLMFSGEAGKLDGFALANRLSYFLWKSMPDEELFELAKSGQLSDPKVLAVQVDRMLDDRKSNRFVKDFFGQWLWLHKINATTPDDGLYPEYDELLGDSIPQEPELFLTELIKENLSLTNMIDSDFTFVNRRLAKLYDIPNVEGQSFQKISLPADSPRGGVLTQAAILKTTANGTTTSPVMRGNFVLTNFFGTPPSPPPPGIGSIEPDTRGKTTIREILKSHREMESCNQCHREIDPPGFALESFDPIGGFREHYRADGGVNKFGEFEVKNPPKRGQPVDASGVTSAGKEFAGINEYKKLLLEQKEQIARNFISRLIVYATGAEIQFADREKVEAILAKMSENDYAVRDIIHEVIQSQMFLNK